MIGIHIDRRVDPGLGGQSRVSLISEANSRAGDRIPSDECRVRRRTSVYSTKYGRLQAPALTTLSCTSNASECPYLNINLTCTVPLACGFKS